MAGFTGDLEFCKLLRGHGEVDLVNLMLEFAADAYPQLDRLASMLEIDRLAVACSEGSSSLETTKGIRESLAGIGRVLFEVEGFHGDRENYYDPRNSYLNEVLARRTGIPISLSMLYVAVATRVGLRAFGVNTPGHFLVGCQTPRGHLYVDPFNGGDILSRDECLQRLGEITGQPELVTVECLQQAEPRVVAVRMLRNLKTAYAMENRWPALVPVQRRLAVLLANCAEEQRDLGLVYLRAGYPHEALPLLERHLSGCGKGEQSEVLQASVRTARKMLAELN